VINAVAHRDYFEKGANVMVEMFDDRIEITSYGGLVKGLKREDFGKKSVLRNPNIANLLQRAGYIEKMGTGINKIKRLMAEAGLPPVEFEFDTFFTVIFKRKKAEIITEIFGAKFSENFSVKGKQLDRMVSIIIRAAQNKDLKVPELADKFDVSIRTLYEEMKRLQKWDVLRFEGASKTGRYVLTEKGRQMIKDLVE
jgi:ATP-dependent DNA helicase RecG